MSDGSNGFWKWVAGIIATIISGVTVYYLTEGASPDKQNPVIQPIPTPNELDSSVPSVAPQPTNTESKVSKTGVAIVFSTPLLMSEILQMERFYVWCECVLRLISMIQQILGIVQTIIPHPSCHKRVFTDYYLYYKNQKILYSLT